MIKYVEIINMYGLLVNYYATAKKSSETFAWPKSKDQNATNTLA